MNDITKRYKETTNAIGVTLLVWVILFLVFSGINLIAQTVFPTNAGSVSLEIALSIMYDVAYLIAFMLPTAVFCRLLRDSKTERMRLDVKLTWDTLLIVLAGVSCIFAFSYLNGIFMSFFEEPISDSMINEVGEYVPNYKLVLQFITIALVPAFCEEFLFRGVILSNLMPYGKGLAIVGSSVLFGLMHGNFHQFLYTTVAGVILGVVYVLTDSIWCSIFVHLINNSVSIVQTAVIERFDDSTASILFAIVEGSIFAVGVVSLVILVICRGKKVKKTSEEIVGVFGKSLEEDADSPKGFYVGLSISDSIRFFLCPPMLMFLVYSITNAFLRFI